MNSRHIVVLCSCPDEAVATRIAATLVREKPDACVNRLAALRSTYVWDGAICNAAEVLPAIKTQAGRYEAVEARIRALHPCEVPEIIAIPVVAGSTGCLEWVTRASTGSGDAPAGSDR